MSSQFQKSAAYDCLRMLQMVNVAVLKELPHRTKCTPAKNKCETAKAKREK